MEQINEILKVGVEKFFDEAKKIEQLKGDAILKLISMSEEEFKNKVCIYNGHRPFCPALNEDYFKEFEKLKIDPKKFDNELEYRGFLEITKKYMKMIEPIVAVEGFLNNEIVKFSVPCPNFLKDWCLKKNKRIDLKQLLTEEDLDNF